MNFALITARGGSKGLPRKNVLSLGGKPLIAWTIEAALNAQSIDRVFVSTEDLEIAAISSDFGAEVIPRPLELAQDCSSSEEVISHALMYWKSNNLSVKSFALLQPTSPFRNGKHIDDAYDIFNAKKANLVLSVVEPNFCLAKAYKLNDDGTLSGMFFPEAPYLRRQDLPASYMPNGAIYLIKSLSYEENNSIPKTHVYPYIMSEKNSLDIDNKKDLLVANNLLIRKEK